MISRIKNYFIDIWNLNRISIALTKGSISSNLRKLDMSNPATWEFSGFSQNGEDGILQILRTNLLSSNRFFIEIGSANGYENNSSWLAIVEKYRGIMVDGNKKLIGRIKRTVSNYNIGLQCIPMFVNDSNINFLFKKSIYPDPDIFSLDIDGNDFYVAQAIFSSGFRPKIFIVEYNSVFGPDKSITIKYKENFNFSRAHKSQLYYGVSIQGWINFFTAKGYKFVTVDTFGVNAFFVDPAFFNADFLSKIRGLQFTENLYQLNKFNASYEEQFKIIQHMDFVEIKK